MKINESEIERLHAILENRRELARLLEAPLVEVKSTEEWGFGSANVPHRMRMRQAVERAKQAAENLMREVAEDILRQFDADLRAGGVETRQS